MSINRRTLIKGVTASVFGLPVVGSAAEAKPHWDESFDVVVVGYGGAEKKQVMEMTKSILHLTKLPRPDDAADALALAICHGHSRQAMRYEGLL